MFTQACLGQALDLAAEEFESTAPGDLPHPGTEPVSPVATALQKDSLPSEPRGKPLWYLGGCK